MRKKIKESIDALPAPLIAETVHSTKETDMRLTKKHPKNTQNSYKTENLEPIN